MFNRYAGQYLAGFKLIELVGYGPMAGVFRAVDPDTHRDVAVKVMADHLNQNRVFAARFQQEMILAANLEHPNLLSALRFGEENGVLYHITPYYAGGSLVRHIPREGMPLLKAALIILQAASALNLIHSRGMIHRNLKPGNIILDGESTAYLADFGLMRAWYDAARLAGTEPPAGTPQYLSPEQGQNREADYRSDVYALGAVLFEMLIGSPPFTGATPVQIIAKHVQAPPPNPSQINPRIPPQVSGAILRALSKNPMDRYPSAGEFALALEMAIR